MRNWKDGEARGKEEESKSKGLEKVELGFHLYTNFRASIMVWWEGTF